MNYEEVTDKCVKKFKKEYKAFVSELINNVEKEKFQIDFSNYISKTVEKPSLIIKDFLKSENIEDHRITDVAKSLNLKLSFYLEMITFKEREKLNTELFNKIIEKNNSLNK